jgi:hypothetical protein
MNTITQYTSPPASAPRSHYSYNELNAREKASSCIAFSSVVTVCWIDETASNLVPFIIIFNLGDKKSEQVLNQGSRVGGITRGSLILPEILRQHPKNEPLHCRAEDTRNHFPDTQAYHNELKRSVS